MRYYKDTTNHVHALESEAFEHLLPAGCVPITEAEAEALRPQPEMPVQIPVVTPWQIRKALNQLGLRATVEVAVASADQETKDGWEFAQEFRRDNPLIAGLAVALNKTEEEIDALFELAGSM